MAAVYGPGIGDQLSGGVGTYIEQSVDNGQTVYERTVQLRVYRHVAMEFLEHHLDAGLFKGVQVRAESLETIVEGGVAFATPEQEDMGMQAKPGQTFALFEDPQEAWLRWAPKIALP